jgi:cell division protein FtsB
LSPTRPKPKKTRRKKFAEEAKVKTHVLFLLALLLIFAGCEGDNHVKLLEDKNAQLEKENRQLQQDIEAARAENSKLANQIESLVELSPEVRIDSLYELESVKLTRYTNFYDRDKDGRKEKLIVYIQPVDSQGDIIKASGSIEIELWDLNKDDDKGALLAKWQIEPDELKKMWFATIVTSNYRLVFDIADVVKSFDQPYTVKMTLTDYVSGKIFIEQCAIEP